MSFLLLFYSHHASNSLIKKVMQYAGYQGFYNYIMLCHSSPECHVYCALAGDVWPGHFMQDTASSVGAGPELLFPASPLLSRTHPALSRCQLLPHLPSTAGPVPRPGSGWRSPTETDQREVRMERRLRSFVVLTLSHLLPS